MNRLSRREFAGLLAAAGMGAATRAPDVQFPTEPRERLAVATYPFRNEVGKKQTLAQFAQSIPSTFQIHGIEPWSHHLESTEPDYVRGLHEAFTKAGVRVVNIPVDIRANLCGNAQERETALADYRKWIDAAVTLASPSIRIHVPGKAGASDFDCAVSGLRAVAEYGASRNIVVNVENDDPQAEQPERIVRVLKAVKSPFMRALPDFANSMTIHNDQMYNRQALSLLFPLAYNVCHVKNMLQDGKTIYRVDVDPLFAIARETGYKGFFSMEWDAEGDPYAGTKHLIAASLRNLA